MRTFSAYYKIKSKKNTTFLRPQGPTTFKCVTHY